MAEHVSDYRAHFHLRRGGLHQWARNSQGWKGSDSDPLPESLKEKAKHSDNPHVAKMGNFSVNFGGK
jgi:hypothetical protein